MKIYILINKISYKNNLVYKILHKTLTGEKPLLISFDKVDGFSRIYSGTRYLALFGSENYNIIFDGIKYLIGVKIGTIFLICHNYANVCWLMQFFTFKKKKLIFHNFIILIKSVWNEDKNKYSHNIFSEKGLYVSANSNNKQVSASVINATLWLNWCFCRNWY